MSVWRWLKEPDIDRGWVSAGVDSVISKIGRHPQKSRRNFYVPGLGFPGLVVLVLMLAAIGYPGFATAQFGHTPDKQEILMMPQLCQWMGYGKRAGMDPALIPKAPPFDVSGCTRYHYYCWAHLDLLRAEKNAYTNPGLAKEKFDRAISTLKGQVQHHNSVPECSKYLRSDVSYTLGKTLERYARFTKSKKFYGEAIGPLLQSIELTPGDERPYQVLGDVYAALDKRQQAEESIYSGLEINPESKTLLRRYKEIGGKRPLPTKKLPAPVDAVRVDGQVPQDGGTLPVGTQKTTAPAADENPGAAQANSVVKEPAQKVEAQAEKDSSTSPRYCRFCADADNNQNNVPPVPSQTESSNPVAGKPPCRFCP